MATRYIACLLLTVACVGCTHFGTSPDEGVIDEAAAIHLIERSPATDGLPVAAGDAFTDAVLRKAGRPINGDSDHIWLVTQEDAGDGEVLTRVKSLGRWETSQMRDVHGRYQPVNLANISDEGKRFLAYSLYAPTVDDLLEAVTPDGWDEPSGDGGESPREESTAEDAPEASVEPLGDVAGERMDLADAASTGVLGASGGPYAVDEEMGDRVEVGGVADTDAGKADDALEEAVDEDAASGVSVIDDAAVAEVVPVDVESVERIVGTSDETPLEEVVLDEVDVAYDTIAVENDVPAFDEREDGYVETPLYAEDVSRRAACSHVLEPPLLRAALQSIFDCYGGYRLLAPRYNEPPDYRLEKPLDLTEYDIETIRVLVDKNYDVRSEVIR